MCHILRSNRQIVDLIGKLMVSLDSRDVGIDKDGCNVCFFESFYRLRA